MPSIITRRSRTGIYVFEMNCSSGELTPVQVFELENPSWVTIDADSSHLYAVSEVATWKGASSTGGITAFAIDSDTGTITPIDDQPTHGAGPAHLRRQCNLRRRLRRRERGDAGTGDPVHPRSAEPNPGRGPGSAELRSGIRHNRYGHGGGPCASGRGRDVSRRHRRPCCASEQRRLRSRHDRGQLAAPRLRQLRLQCHGRRVTATLSVSLLARAIHGWPERSASSAESVCSSSIFRPTASMVSLSSGSQLAWMGCPRNADPPECAAAR